MTTFKSAPTTRRAGGHDDKLNLAEIVEIVTGGDMPLRFTAYDGSAAGPEDSPFGLALKSPRGATYIATAPGDLGIANGMGSTVMNIGMLAGIQTMFTVLGDGRDPGDFALTFVVGSIAAAAGLAGAMLMDRR